MPPTRETVASIKKKYRSKLPKTIDVLSVLFDEQAKESRVVLNCNFHGEQDPVTLGYLRKTKFLFIQTFVTNSWIKSKKQCSQIFSLRTSERNL